MGRGDGAQQAIALAPPIVADRSYFALFHSQHVMSCSNHVFFGEKNGWISLTIYILDSVEPCNSWYHVIKMTRWRGNKNILYSSVNLIEAVGRFKLGCSSLDLSTYVIKAEWSEYFILIFIACNVFGMMKIVLECCNRLETGNLLGQRKKKIFFRYLINVWRDRKIWKSTNRSTWWFSYKYQPHLWVHKYFLCYRKSDIIMFKYRLWHDRPKCPSQNWIEYLFNLLTLDSNAHNRNAKHISWCNRQVSHEGSQNNTQWRYKCVWHFSIERRPQYKRKQTCWIVKQHVKW